MSDSLSVDPDSSMDDDPALSLLLSVDPDSSMDDDPALSLNPSDSLMPESFGGGIPSVVIDVVKNPYHLILLIL